MGFVENVLAFWMRPWQREAKVTFTCTVTLSLPWLCSLPSNNQKRTFTERRHLANTRELQRSSLQWGNLPLAARWYRLSRTNRHNHRRRLTGCRGCRCTHRRKVDGCSAPIGKMKHLKFLVWFFPGVIVIVQLFSFIMFLSHGLLFSWLKLRNYGITLMSCVPLEL